MDHQQIKATTLTVVVALGLGALTYVVDPTTTKAAEVYADECSGSHCGTPPTTGGGSGSGSGSSVLLPPFGYW